LHIIEVLKTSSQDFNILCWELVYLLFLQQQSSQVEMISVQELDTEKMRDFPTQKPKHNTPFQIQRENKFGTSNIIKLQDFGLKEDPLHQL